MLRASAECFVVTESTRASVEQAFLDRRLSKVTLRTFEGGLDGALSRYAAEASPSLIILETEGADDIGRRMEALAEVCEPGTDLILLGIVNDIELYRSLRRQGVADYLPLPLSPERLADAALEVFSGPDSHRVGQVIAFIGTKGGCGNSFLAHNTAFSLSRPDDADAIVLDLDIPFGCGDLNFNIETASGIRNVLAQPDRIDELFLQRFATKYDDRLALLAAPATLDASGHIDAERLEAAIEVIRQHYRYVLIDLPHVWSGWVQRILRYADTVVLTTPLDLAAVRNTRNLLDWTAQERVGAPPPRVVLNGAGARGAAMIDVGEFKARLAIRDPIVVPHDPASFRLAMGAGRMLEEVRPKAKSALAIRRLASSLAESAPESRVPRAGPVRQVTSLLTSVLKPLRGR